jgi:predicted hotdog family 3-hydroxylacyl-ACP dehydratase
MIVIDRDRIATMIPHAGAMCLLDGVLSWDAVSVRCTSSRYRHADNPLRRMDGSLGAACGIEIAAQAMAVHGGLIAGTGRPRQGYLAGLRDVRLATEHLDMAAGDLIVEAELLMGDASGATYRFMLERDGIGLLSGRATLLLGVAK